MPSILLRQLLKLTGGLKNYGTTTLGGSTDYTTLTATGDTAPGRQTMAGKARALKEIYLRPADFRDAASSGNGVILRSSCILIDVSGSIFTTLAGSAIAVPVLAASANVACMYSATTTVPVPLDADTTGCIIPIIEYTIHDTMLNAGSSTAFYVAAAYLRGGMSTACVVRTAACVSYAASYQPAASGQHQTACLPALPSFGSADKLLAVQVGWDAESASDTAGSPVAIFGTKLRYVASKLGAQSPD